MTVPLIPDVFKHPDLELIDFWSEPEPWFPGGNWWESFTNRISSLKLERESHMTANGITSTPSLKYGWLSGSYGRMESSEGSERLSLIVGGVPGKIRCGGVIGSPYIRVLTLTYYLV